MAEFNDLPNEIKLHIFSFLSARDLAGVNGVDRRQHALVNAEARLWRARARQDFARELDDASANEAGYAALHKKMYAELNEECGVILAMRWIHQKLGADRQQNMLEFNVQHELPVVNRLDRDDLMRAFEFRTRDQFFAAFVECRDRHITQGDCTDVSDQDMQCVLGVNSPEISYDEILRLYPDFNADQVIEVVMATLVRARASTALGFFLRKIPEAKLIEIQPMLVRACEGVLYYADVEMLKVLLHAGLDVNSIVHRGEAQEFLLHSWLRQLEAFVWRIELQAMFRQEHGQAVNGLADDMNLFCTKQLDNYMELAALLLNHGADPDHVPLGDHAVSGRQAATMAALHYQIFDFDNVSNEYFDQVLKVVMNAEVLEKNTDAEPVLKRPRP